MLYTTTGISFFRLVQRYWSAGLAISEYLLTSLCICVLPIWIKINNYFRPSVGPPRIYLPLDLLGLSDFSQDLKQSLAEASALTLKEDGRERSFASSICNLGIPSWATHGIPYKRTTRSSSLTPATEDMPRGVEDVGDLVSGWSTVSNKNAPCRSTEEIDLLNQYSATSGLQVMAAISEWENMGLSRGARRYVRIDPKIRGTDTEFTNEWRKYENLCRNCESPGLTQFQIHGTPRAYQADLVKCWVHFTGWKLSKEWIAARKEWKSSGKEGEPIPVCFPPGYKPRFSPDRVAAKIPDNESPPQPSKASADNESLSELSKASAGNESPPEPSKASAVNGSLSELSGASADNEPPPEAYKTSADNESPPKPFKASAGNESPPEPSKASADNESLSELSKASAGNETPPEPSKASAVNGSPSELLGASADNESTPEAYKASADNESPPKPSKASADNESLSELSKASVGNGSPSEPSKIMTSVGNGSPSEPSKASADNESPPEPSKASAGNGSPSELSGASADNESPPEAY
ncbi:MAG: hypothetical protein Q9188_005062 [Gyalolechia gomerana]